MPPIAPITADAHEFGLHVKQGGWRLGLLVARNVERSKPGTKIVAETTILKKVSAREFGRRADTATDRVLRHLDAWNRAAANGTVPPATDLHPGQELPAPWTLDVEHLPPWDTFYQVDPPRRPKVRVAPADPAPSVDEVQVVIHLDGDARNNDLSNLRVETQQVVHPPADPFDTDAAMAHVQDTTATDLAQATVADDVAADLRRSWLADQSALTALLPPRPSDDRGLREADIRNAGDTERQRRTRLQPDPPTSTTVQSRIRRGLKSDAKESVAAVRSYTRRLLDIARDPAWAADPDLADQVRKLGEQLTTIAGVIGGPDTVRVTDSALAELIG